VVNLSRILSTHSLQHRLGTVLVAPCDVLLSESTTLQPDLLFVARAREAIIQPAYVQGAPDLVVEVLSPTTAQRDRGAKRQLYAQFGVPSLWLADATERVMAAFVLEAGEYRQVALVRGDDDFSAPPFAELVIHLADVWA
jgi:Uma2 family endonuclease